MSDKPTTKYTFEEQFAAGLAAGLSAQDMLKNVDKKIDNTVADIAAECRRCPNPEYAASAIRKYAERAIHLRELRGFVLGKALNV